MIHKLLFIAFLSLPVVAFAQSTKKALVIGMDGCRPDALQAAQTPHIDALIANGLYSPDALNDDITISGPGWSAILCGVWSDKHLVTNNNFSGNNYNDYPSIFHYIESHDAMLNTVSICHWSPINTFIIQDDADNKANVSSDAAVASEAANYLALTGTDVLFLHFDDIDHAGHAHGFSPTIPEYIAAIESVDTHIGTVIQAMQQRPDYSSEDWLVFITTDHGGIGTGHGGSTIEEERVFVLASGDHIPTEIIYRDSSVVFTPNCLADSVALSFDGENDQVKIPPDPIFDFGATQDFTVECRVRTATAADVAIVGNKDWDTGLNKGFVFSFRFASGPEWKVNIGDGTNRVDINTGGAIADNQWHTLSVSFDRDGLMKMYEDGTLISSASISSIGDISTGAGLYFGTDINGSYDYTGDIAEVRVWNKVIADQQIADWHCTALNATHPDDASLLGHWRMKEGAGSNEVVDQSTHGNDGSIVGASWKKPDSLINYDYSQTPRLTDVPPTVLTHLGIPLETSWNLDGTSLIAGSIILPLDLTDFYGRASGSTIMLYWTTQSEINFSHFELEKQTVQGSTFSAIGRIEAEGSRTAQQTYEFIDHTPHNGRNHYRLKQVDLDGTFTYSPTIVVPYRLDEATIHVYPTTTNDRIYIDATEAIVRISIYDIKGNLIKTIANPRQEPVTQIDLSSLPAQLYLLTVETSSQLETFRLAKQE